MMPDPERRTPISVTSLSFQKSMERAHQGVDQILNNPLRVKIDGLLTVIFNGQQPIEVGTRQALIGLYHNQGPQDTRTFVESIAQPLPQSSWEEQRSASDKAEEQVVTLLDHQVIQPDAFSREMTRQASLIPEEVLEDSGGCTNSMLLAVELTSLGTQGMAKIIKERGISNLREGLS